MSADKQTYPPLTADEFNLGCGVIYSGVPLCENEDGEYIYAFGHVPVATMVLAVNAMDADNGFAADESITAADVQHRYAITEKSADDPDGWWIRWGNAGVPVAADDEGAFPLTVIER